jgi:hypothetical protein
MTDAKRKGGRKGGRKAANAPAPSQVPDSEAKAPTAYLAGDPAAEAAAMDAAVAALPRIGEITVHCSHDEIVPVARVVPNPRNPNTHPERQIDLLARIIQAQGWRAPVTISNRSGFIVRGHGRYLAALRLGLPAVPVDRQDYASEAEEWADLIADNRIAELAEMDMARLKEDLLALDDGAFDMELTGFDATALEDLMTAFPSGPPAPVPTPPQQQEPVLKSDHLIEIRCSKEALPAIRGLLGEIGKVDGVTVDIS